MLKPSRLIVCWLLSLLFSSLANAQDSPKTLVVAGDVWCPINCAEDAEMPGFFVELAQQIFADAGIKVEYRTINWARAVRETQQGKFDALIGAGVEDAPGLLFTATAPADSRVCFYAKQGSAWRFDGVKSLSTITLGSINGYSYGDQLDAYIRRNVANALRVQQASGDSALAITVEKVRVGRVDVVVENRWVMEYFLRHEGAGEPLQEVGCWPVEVPIYLAFSPVLESSERHRDIFQAGLLRYQHNGRFNALLQRYGLQMPAPDDTRNSR